MISNLDTPRISRTLLCIAAAFVACSLLWGMPGRTLATAVGAGVALLNLAALRWLTGRIVDRGTADAEGGANASRSKLLASLLLMGKIGALIAVVYVLMSSVKLDPIGLAFGLGVLFVGPVVAGLMATAPRPLKPSAASAAREER